VALAPELGRTQITLGFAALAEFRSADAQAAFEKAIAVDSADPLPHLGLGLARISMGGLEQGRSDIEVAVGLGSNDALLRAYLGKAYFEEKRGPLDSQQFDIAKQLDPNDPTAFLYDGIAKQTQNRPVEAARDLEQSIALNDNRAAYRGRLLLDKDRAARGTSLARAYNDLGFTQLGVNESTSSLVLDPSNASAHRFLSDTYRNVRRREVARVSELLQAQMMQDNNINPVQPSVSSTNLNIVTAGGPASAGFSEFTPLFERNKTQFNASGFGGDDNTGGGEVVVSSVFDRYSISVGAFDFNSNGFRDNSDLRHKIHNLYGQAAITPALNIQAEYGHRESTNGDLAMNFGLDDFDPSFRRDFKEETGRLGVRFTPNSRTNLLFSAIYSDREQDTVGFVTHTEDPGFPPFIPPSTTDTSQETATDETSKQYEAQYLYQGQDFNVIAGATYAEVDQEFLITDNLAISFPPISISNALTTMPTIKDTRGYVYGNFNLPSQVAWTLGVSYHDYDEDDIDFDRFNPKIGVQWDLSESLRVRAAWFKVVKPALASNRTLEPTQVAGFNQYFDDTNATRSERFGGAIDWEMNQNVFLGAELSRRELTTPEFQFIAPSTTDWEVSYQDWDELSHRAYAYWTPTNRVSLSAEAVYDKFEGGSAINPNVPLMVRTLSYPLRVNYFQPNGFFAGAGITYVDQEVDPSAIATSPKGDSDFTVTDISIGYRFPRRMGIASLSIQNLTDEEFEYQDDSFREFQDEPSTGPYIPDRTVMARITLNF
jgi:tetratricopeptide (TPR) repeat protein